jgi:hypothetical protein
MRLISFLLASFLLIGGAVLAHDKIDSDFEAVEACAGDVATLCSGVLPGDGRIRPA